MIIAIHQTLKNHLPDGDQRRLRDFIMRPMAGKDLERLFTGRFDTFEKLIEI